ncbi:MAG: KamA family radical SAM protein [Planctomycetota bacterium]|jgi:lysine 2,3-aminomutase
MAESSTHSRPASPAAGVTSAPEGAGRADWRWQHAHALRSLDDVTLAFPGRFDLSGIDRQGVDAAIALYGMRVTPYYMSLARRASGQDPVWALSVPSAQETARTPDERDDPIGDEADGLSPLPGVTRRYRDRVLLMPTPTCSVHCRHCFRRRLIGNPDFALDEAALDRAVAWIEGETELREVILTGGDPLTLSDDRLLGLLGRLAAIPHVRWLRLHTRMPVVNPFRVTTELVEGLARVDRPVRVVGHWNHPVELGPASVTAVRRLRLAGLEVLNQSVLLAGLNDSADVHRELLSALLDAGIRPYALHHADLVPGTAHLRTSVHAGTALLRALRGTLPGHALPQYLLDVPGGHGKVPLDHPWAQPGLLGGLRVEAPDGTHHDYGGSAPARR